MAQLTLAGLSGDGKRLLLVDEKGVEYSLAVDDTLRAALRGERSRIGQLEIQMESNLRPRDIQARIRAGESPDSVAQAAQTTVEKIMPFAAPVLAERAHVAERAQLSSVRRRSGDQGARTLGEAVSAHLRAANVDPEHVEWDAWRREDGRWTLTGAFSGAGRTGVATFSFDMRGNFVTIDDEDARWLVGDASATPESAVAPAAVPTGPRRLGVVPPPSDDLGDDALALVGEQPGEAFLDDSGNSASDETAEIPAARAERHEPEAPAETQESVEEAPAATEEVREEPRRPRRRGRASVPSWDEIMFGGGKGD